MHMGVGGGGGHGLKTPGRVGFDPRTASPKQLHLLLDGQRHIELQTANLSIDSNGASTPIAAAGGRESITRTLPSGRRFVAGEAFFNYEAFGSLRPEFVPVRMFSTSHLGLAINALLAGFTFTFFKYAFRQLLAEILRIDDDSQKTAIKYLIEWPGSFSIFMGFLSDCRPLFGYRRKSYMILGWTMAALMFLITAIIDYTAAHSNSILASANVDRSHAAEKDVARYGKVFLALMLLASLFLQIMWIASLSMAVEFAQREHLHQRGKLQALYFILYHIMAFFAQIFMKEVLSPDKDERVFSNLSIGHTSIILTVACALPLPFLFYNLDEERVTSLVGMSFKRRIREFWRFCHQNVVNRTLFFLVGHFFVIGIYSSNVRNALNEWCGITAEVQLTQAVTQFACLTAALIFWMVFLVNYSWRKLALIGSLIFIVGYTTFTVMVIYNVSRASWFYVLLSNLTDMPRAWIKLFALVLPTEIADQGREGVAVGLVYSFQLLIGITAHMLSAGLGSWLPFKVTMDDVRLDSSSTRMNVLIAALITFAINMGSIGIVFTLPQQKLDAQQLRAFGGYNRYASYGIAVTFTLLLLANFALNTLALV